MPKKKRTIEELQKADQLTLSEIARLASITYGKAQHYMNEGLLTFSQEYENATRYFDRKQSLRRITKIDVLKSEGLSVAEIAERLTKTKTVKLDEDQQRLLKSILNDASKQSSSRDQKKQVIELKKTIFA